MKKFGKVTVKHHRLILIIGILLLIPSLFGMIGTRINYDMLHYLPKDMDTVKGQDILLDRFGKGAVSTMVVEGMDQKDIVQLKAKIEKVNHVDSVIWYDSLSNGTVPMELLPKKYYDAFNNGNATLMVIFFDSSTSASETMTAIKDIRKITTKDCFLTGMSALVTDLKDLCEKEEPIYVGLAVLLATLVMMVFLDSWIIPFVFLAGIGMAILWNLGSNIFMGEISYITKALSSVLQLAVTMDYSIFLWHKYEEEREITGDDHEAMAEAVNKTLSAVVGSSITTVAGFVALCFMTYKLGMDLGIVMAKGVILGVISCVTILPAMILVFDRFIEKTRHRSLIPDMSSFAKKVTAKPYIQIGIFIIVLIPALFAYNQANKEVYYDIGGSLPKSLPSVVANEKQAEHFKLGSTYMALVNLDLSNKELTEMTDRIKDLKGIKAAMGLDSIVGGSLPDDFIPSELTSKLKSGKYQLVMITSEYEVASDQVNKQVADAKRIIKEYDKKGLLIGEAPATYDLIKTTSRDFDIVNTVSILLVFLIILLVFKSASLPVILVAVIEFAIFINLGLSHLMGVSLPFIAPICISTIQLGSTVDYAILMTTRYKAERLNGKDTDSAIRIALATSIPSIIVSGLGFFAATFGVAMYSNIDMIKSLCTLMSRGAIISVLAVIFILPAMLHVFDKVICKTTASMRHISKSGLAREV